MNMLTSRNRTRLLFYIVLIMIFFGGCNNKPAESVPTSVHSVPHKEKYGIYSLDIETNKVELIYGSARELYTSALRQNNKGDKFVFCQKIDGDEDTHFEVCTIGLDGSNYQRVTNNSFWEVYPAWSSDDTRIAFISKRGKDFDIYIINPDGSKEEKLHDSGDNDADIHWAGNKIVFTSGFKIWSINDDGSKPVCITNPVDAGKWGKANLPKGDYDPRFSPDGSKIAFERLENTENPHGGYNLFVIYSDGTRETRLTNTGYSQGLASWSNSGYKIVYNVGAIDNEGKYDIYIINADGTDNHNITPKYFPPDFLCHSPIFSKDDSKIYFIGQWWE